jgi:hypothetical protein
MRFIPRLHLSVKRDNCRVAFQASYKCLKVAAGCPFQKIIWTTGFAFALASDSAAPNELGILSLGGRARQGRPVKTEMPNEGIL